MKAEHWRIETKGFSMMWTLNSLVREFIKYLTPLVCKELVYATFGEELEREKEFCFALVVRSWWFSSHLIDAICHYLERPWSIEPLRSLALLYSLYFHIFLISGHASNDLGESAPQAFVTNQAMNTEVSTKGPACTKRKIIFNTIARLTDGLPQKMQAISRATCSLKVPSLALPPVTAHAVPKSRTRSVYPTQNNVKMVLKCYSPVPVVSDAWRQRTKELNASADLFWTRFCSQIMQRHVSAPEHS